MLPIEMDNEDDINIYRDKLEQVVTADVIVSGLRGFEGDFAGDEETVESCHLTMYPRVTNSRLLLKQLFYA